MSNLLILAQTTQTAASLQELLLPLLVTAGLAGLSAWTMYWRRWQRIPPIPRDDRAPSAALLAMALGLCFVAYYGVVNVCAVAMGITSETAQRPEVMRKLLFCQPAAHLMAMGLALAILSPYMPRALEWGARPTRFIRRGAGSFLLALPWVYLAIMLVSIYVQQYRPGEKTDHAIFELWRMEGPGITPFKLFAFFSAVVTAPLAEEILFRGLLQRLIHRLSNSAPLAVALTSALFAATHNPWTNQPPVFVLSVFLGWAYFRTGSIRVVMVTHALFNLSQFAFFLAVVR